MKVVGITIGPIVETLMEASTPASLWFASYFFSDITRRLCEEIKTVFTDVNILSPYYDSSITMMDGVGKFHDRIIFCTRQYDNTKMNEIISIVKDKSINSFSLDLQTEKNKEFLVRYLQINYVAMDMEEMEHKNALLGLSDALNQIELMKSFPTDNTNHVLRRALQGKSNDTNFYIKESPLFGQINVVENQLRNKEGIWPIDAIARAKNTIQDNSMKKYNYYAIVHADGDNMGKFLEGINNEQVTAFSKSCLQYAERASKLIETYGGMTIYAGGDDLLFLAPVENPNIGKDVFTLCHDINKLFIDLVKEQNTQSVIPTISFGVAIQYKKSPLYEALSTSRELLYLAKQSVNKNSLALSIQKHSGQKVSLVIPNEELSILTNVIKENQSEETLHSMLRIVDTMYPMIHLLTQEAMRENITKESFIKAWCNFFDNVSQNIFERFYLNIANLYYDSFVANNSNIHVITKNEKDSNDTVIILSTLLRIGRFFAEGGY